MSHVCRWYLGLALLLVSGGASAQTAMRCDTHVISRGLTFLEVAERCGPPDLTQRRAEILVHGIYVPVEEWYYELGSNRFRRLLTFENGRLRRIEQRPKPVASIDKVLSEP
jgi:hypothetical protein